MIKSLLANTNAYKVFKSDIDNSTLSHAYLLVCEDGDMLEEYLKAFAKTLFCADNTYCNDCRTCRLIDKKSLFDVKFYPSANKLKVADADDIVLKAYDKPLEFDKKAFILVNAQDMTAQAQNKLLKTLEEPPKNTYLILGATTVYPILSTVLSRVKRLDIPPFSLESLETQLSNYYGETANVAKIKKAVALSLGKFGLAKKLYESGENEEVESLCYEILLGLKSSKDAYRFAGKITKENYRQVLTVMQNVINSVLRYKLSGENNEINSNGVIRVAEVYGSAALVYVAEKLTELERKVNFNLNLSATVDGILFSILEGKYKWQKS